MAYPILQQTRYTAYLDSRYYMFQALLLFPGPNCNIVVGSILLAESFAFMCLGLMNKVK